MSSRASHIVSFALALAVLAAAPAFAQLMIDSEDARIHWSGDLFDNGRRVTWQDNLTPKPRIVPGARKGNRCIEHGANPANPGTGNTKQRSEHRFGGIMSEFSGDWSLPEGSETYVGFSFRLDAHFQYNGVNEFLSIWQMKQTPPSGGPPNAWLSMGTDLADPQRWQISWRWGPGISGWSSDSLDLGYLRRGVWYDVVIGFRMAVDGPTGWVKTWIKESTDAEFTLREANNIRIGYSQFLRSILTTQVGIYRKRTEKWMRIRFDEVKFGRTFYQVQPTGSLINGVTPHAVGDLDPGRAAQHAINGSNLNFIGAPGEENDPESYTHTGGNTQFGENGANWAYQASGSGTNSVDDLWYAVDLGDVYTVDTMSVFNFGVSSGTRNNRGVEEVDIYYRTRDLGNNRHGNDQPFDPSGWTFWGTHRFTLGPSGTALGPDIVGLGGITARYVAFDINTTFPGATPGLAGIGEVQFFSLGGPGEAPPGLGELD